MTSRTSEYRIRAPRRLYQAMLAPANGALPKPEREAERAQAREQVQAPELRALRRRCQQVYETYLQVQAGQL